MVHFPAVSVPLDPSLLPLPLYPSLSPLPLPLPPPLPPLTFVLVGVQQVLELGVEDLQVLLDEDLLTLAGELVLGGLVEVDLDPSLLLQETALCLQGKTTGG